MTDSEYTELVYEEQKIKFLKIIEINKIATQDFKKDDLVVFHRQGLKRKIIYKIVSIENDYAYTNRKKEINYFFDPSIRIFGVKYSKNRNTTKKEFLNVFEISLATDLDLEEFNKNKREVINKQRKLKRDTDPLFKLQCVLRSRVRTAFKSGGWKKDKLSVDLLGVPFEIAKKHIERQFKKGMTWENHGEWEIDHKIPFASAKTDEELRELCHYTNLQPLWAKDNRKKHSKIVPTQKKLII